MLCTVLPTIVKTVIGTVEFIIARVATRVKAVFLGIEVRMHGPGHWQAFAGGAKNYKPATTVVERPRVRR